MSHFRLMGADEVQLFVTDYIVENMKGIVLCVHGMCEHSKRYESIALFLNESGYSVYTYDHRGHGDSLLENEKKGYLGTDGYNKMIYDLNVVVSYIQEKYPQQKLYLLGHSMGSFVVTSYIERFQSIDGVILSGSNYRTKALKFGRFVGKIACIFKGEKKEAKLLEKLSFGSFNKQFEPNRTPFDWLCRDEKIVDSYITDENCGFTCTNRFYYDFFGGLLDLSKNMNIKKIQHDLPILIISGEKDPVGHNGKGAKDLYNILRNSITDVELKLYPESRHEILNELNKEEVFQDIVNWLTMIED